MEEILLNLKNPAWWFTGIFFAALLKLLPTLTTPLNKITKKIFRGQRLKRAKYIKSNRHNLAAVNFQSIKSQAFFVVFILVCALYMIWFVVGPLFQVLSVSRLLFIICLIPMASFQIIWMSQEDKAKQLVSEYNKVRAKKR
ncbi:hypothetical protein ABKY47_003920 [Aeromonas hydrophila]